jgi:hypothetical protein
MRRFLNHPSRLWGLVILSAICFSCGSDISPEGTYRGTLVMEDGDSIATLEILPDQKAILKGLFPKTAEGTWKAESVGGGYAKDDLWATFKFPEHRVTLKLQNATEGLIVHEVAARIEGKTILRPIKLKEAKPLLRRASP